MDELFKGYVETKNKKSIEKFKNRKKFKTYEQVEKLQEFAGILAEDIILIDVDDFKQSETLLNMIEEQELICRVYETTRGKHFLFKNRNVSTCRIHTKLACGITADIKLGSKNSYSILKFNNKERKIIYDKFEDEEYQLLPRWLEPVKSKIDFFNMEAGDGRNQALFNYILTLQNNDFNVKEARECIKLINKYILKEHLEDEEIEIVLRNEAFNKPTFFHGNTFLFDKFAKFMINEHHIIKIDKQLHLYRDGIYTGTREDIEAEMIKHISNLSQARRREVMSYIDISIREDTAVADAKYIAFKNGIYNLDTDEIIDFSPNIVITNKIPFNYNKDAQSELVDKTLNKLSINDKTIRKLLEESIGYTFYRRNELRKAFILIGDKSNGKSTYLDMIRTLLGHNNIASLDLKELGERFKTAELVGKLANIGDDIGDDFISNPAVFKKVVSGDRLNVEKKGSNPFEFDNYSKMLFSANNIPRIKDKSGAVISRLIIIPFEAKMSKDDQDFDPFIKYKLRQEECMEYMIKLGIDALKDVLKKSSFTTCDKVQRELEEYEENNNPILMFFKDIDKSEVENQPTKEVYRKYNEFCLHNAFTPLSNIEFSKQVKKYYAFKVISKSIKGNKYRIFTKCTA